LRDQPASTILCQRLKFEQYSLFKIIDDSLMSKLKSRPFWIEFLSSQDTLELENSPSGQLLTVGYLSASQCDGHDQPAPERLNMTEKWT
jgi:hypothetical protein